MVVYIKTQGAKIVKEGRHLLVKKGDDVCNTLFTYKLRQIVIFGNVEMTHRALAQIMRHEIDIVFLTQNGRYLGRIASAESRNVYLHKRQYNLLDDHDFTLRVARSIVAGKLANMATFLMRIKRTRDDSIAGQRARGITDLIGQLPDANSVDSIRGYEGRGSALYFEAFPAGFIDNWGFARRVRRPPTDPVNSILSLLYTFLMNRVYAAVRVAGLDPYPGFLHSIDYGRYSLVLDLMEEFRPIIADSLALSLFNLHILKKDDFYMDKPANADTTSADADDQPDVTKDPMGMINPVCSDAEIFDLPVQRMDDAQVVDSQPTEKYPVKLHPDGFKRVIENFERKLTTEFYYAPAERSITYAEALIQQANHFRKVIEGEANVYQPLLLK